MKYFLLNAESYFVEGAIRSTIYNCRTGRILSLNPQLTKIISKSEQGSPLSKISEYYNYKEIAKEALQKLKKMEYGSFYDNFYRIEKLKPPTTKNSVLESSLPFVTGGFIELTPECNLNCSFCNPDSFKINRLTGCKRWPSSASPKGNKAMQLKDWKEVIKKLYLLKCRTLYFIGGEPLLKKKDLIELFAYAAETGITGIHIFTNGTLFDAEITEAFRKYNVMPVIQVYSDNEEITDAITGIKGSHRQLINNLELLKQNGVKFSLMLVKLDKYADSYSKAAEYFNGFAPIKVINSNIYPDTKDKSGFAKQLFKKDANDIYGGHLPAEQFYLNCERNSCWFQKLSFTFRGDMTPCPMARSEIIGNFLDNRFNNLIKLQSDISKLWNMTRDNIEICKDCEYRYYCKDCRPLEKSTSGSNNIKMRSRFCLYNPYTGEWGGENGK